MAKTEYKVGETFQFGLKTLKCVGGGMDARSALFSMKYGTRLV